jgi:hypothetical protein
LRREHLDGEASVVKGPSLNPWSDYTISTAIILPALFWVSVIGKRLVGFNLLFWAVGHRFEGIDRIAIDDPIVLGLGAVLTACIVLVALSRVRDLRLLRTRGIAIEAEVRRIRWCGGDATVSFRYERNDRTYRTGETVPASIGRAAETSGRVTLLVDPRSPRRCLVLPPRRPGPAEG